MADLADTVSEYLLSLLRGKGTIRAIPSAAPGGGPSAAREGGGKPMSSRPLGSPPAHPPRGGAESGYGGHGDPVLIEDARDAAKDVQQEIAEHLATPQMIRVRKRDVAPRGRVRMNRSISLEGHQIDSVEDVLGPFSLFDGTISAPGAGNSLVPIVVQLPAGTLSPITLLDRYPGAMDMKLRLSSFSFMPTAGTATGLQECYFQDLGGAVVPLGVYSAASGTPYQSIDKKMTTPYTDPGQLVMGTLWINNIGIGGTPVTVRYQLGICYEASLPDPYFNELMLDGKYPADEVKLYRSMEAAG